MKKTIKQFYDMAVVTSAFIDAFPASFPVATAAVNSDLKTQTKELNDLDTAAELYRYTKGLVLAKKSEIEATTLVASIAAAALVALFTKSADIDKAAHFARWDTPAKLKGRSLNTLLQILPNIQKEANTNITVLTSDYAFTAAMLADLQSGIGTLTTMLVAVRESIAKGKSSGKQTLDKMNQIRASLMQLDKTVSVLRLSDPSTYNDYRNMRNIVDAATSHTRYSFRLLDEMGAPVVGAKIRLVSRDGRNPKTGDAITLPTTAVLNGDYEVAYGYRGVIDLEVNEIVVHTFASTVGKQTTFGTIHLDANGGFSSTSSRNAAYEANFANIEDTLASMEASDLLAPKK